MALNEMLATRVLDYIEMHPAEHDQTQWRCGTSMCFAGHAASLSGNGEWAQPTDPFSNQWKDEQGSVGSVSYYAMKYLGISNAEADKLFHADNSLHDIKEILDDIRAGKIEDYNW